MPPIKFAQRTPEWHAARVGKITASLAAACLGLDPYKSRAVAWREIMGRGKQAENRAMAWGRKHEAHARSEYEDLVGELAIETGFWVHPELEWLGASPDGLVGHDGLVELKCPKVLPEQIPTHHRIQMLIQIEVTGRAWCDYYVWTPRGYFMQRVRPAGTSGLIRRLAEFHAEYVVKEVCPWIARIPEPKGDLS